MSLMAPKDKQCHVIENYESQTDSECHLDNHVTVHLRRRRHYSITSTSMILSYCIGLSLFFTIVMNLIQIQMTPGPGPATVTFPINYIIVPVEATLPSTFIPQIPASHDWVEKWNDHYYNEILLDGDYVYQIGVKSGSGAQGGYIDKRHKSNGTLVWLSIINNCTSFTTYLGGGITRDGNSVLAVGQFYNCGSQSGYTTTTSSVQNGHDAMIVKVNADDGQFQWGFIEGFSSSDNYRDIECDDDNNCYAVGTASPNFSQDYFDISVLKVDTNGAHVWSVYHSSVGYFYDIAYGVVVADDNESIFVSGYTAGEYEGTTRIDTYTYNIVVMRLSAHNGTIQWIYNGPSPYGGRAYACTLNPLNGHIVAVGESGDGQSDLHLVSLHPNTGGVVYEQTFNI
jgi:hypothetical protein